METGARCHFVAGEEAGWERRRSSHIGPGWLSIGEEVVEGSRGLRRTVVGRLVGLEEEGLVAEPSSLFR